MRALHAADAADAVDVDVEVEVEVRRWMKVERVRKKDGRIVSLWDFQIGLGAAWKGKRWRRR